MLFLLRGNKSNLELIKRIVVTRNIAISSVQRGEPPLKFTQKDFDEVNRKQMDKFKKNLEKNASEDPYSPVIFLLKTVAVGFILATVGSISYGAYDPGYRKVLRTTFPLAAWTLDLVMAREDETVLSEEEISNDSAPTIFREQLKRNSQSRSSSF